MCGFLFFFFFLSVLDIVVAVVVVVVVVVVGVGAELQRVVLNYTVSEPSIFLWHWPETGQQLFFSHTPPPIRSAAARRWPK